MTEYPAPTAMCTCGHWGFSHQRYYLLACDFCGCESFYLEA